LATPYAHLWAYIREYVAASRGRQVQLSTRKVRWILERAGIFRPARRRSRKLPCTTKTARLLFNAMLHTARRMGVEPIHVSAEHSYTFHKQQLLAVLDNPPWSFRGGDPSAARAAAEEICGHSMIYRRPQRI